MAINPYQEIPLYDFDIISAYNGASLGEMDPHIFAVAEDAFRTMSRLFNFDQYTQGIALTPQIIRVSSRCSLWFLFVQVQQPQTAQNLTILHVIQI